MIKYKIYEYNQPYKYYRVRRYLFGLIPFGFIQIMNCYGSVSSVMLERAEVMHYITMEMNKPKIINLNEWMSNES